MAAIVVQVYLLPNANFQRVTYLNVTIDVLFMCLSIGSGYLFTQIFVIEWKKWRSGWHFGENLNFSWLMEYLIKQHYGDNVDYFAPMNLFWFHWSLLVACKRKDFASFFFLLHATRTYSPMINLISKMELSRLFRFCSPRWALRIAY